MTKEQKQVKEFMVTFGQDCPNFPTEEVSLETRKMRARIMLEEVLETIIAGLGLDVIITWNGEMRLAPKSPFGFEEVKKVDLVELADGLADQHYVGYCGTGNAFGLDMEEIFDNVHQSNMSKIWPEKLVREKVDEIENGNYNLTKVENGYIVKRPDGKVVKPETYTSPKLKEIIEKQIREGRE